MDKTTTQYQWDLEAILENETLEKLYANWTKQMQECMKIYDRIFDTLQNFKTWIKANEKLQILSNRLHNYISNHANIDVTDPIWIGYSQKISNDSNPYNIKTADYDNRILSNEKVVWQYLQDPELKPYLRAFETILKHKPHTLSNQEERLLAELGKTTGGVYSMYESLLTSDIKYADATNSQGQKIQLKTMSSVFINLKSKDATLRKTTWLNFHQAFYDCRNTLTHAVYNNFLSLNTYCEIRHFKDYVSACCFDDEISETLIPFIYQQTAKFRTLHETYSQHRQLLLKQLLNIKTVEPWDNSVELSHKDIHFTITQAQSLVKQALAPLGQEYLNVVQKAFDENWISWLPQSNKYTGAYSIGGTKGLTKFYILMNYDKTLNSVHTLIHELGHSLNSYFYSKTQKIYASTTIFTAEIASITNEMLLNYYLLNKYKDDEQMRLMILDEVISGFFATTSRQIIFSNFEYNIIERIKQNEPITYEVIASLYSDLTQKYLYVKDPSKTTKLPYSLGLITPLRISHFFAGNFYVYKYTIGQIVACIAAHRIFTKKSNFTEQYLKFLSSGTSLSPMETIKILGIDLDQPAAWDEVNEIMDDFIEKFKKIKKIKS